MGAGAAGGRDYVPARTARYQRAQDHLAIILVARARRWPGGRAIQSNGRRTHSGCQVERSAIRSENNFRLIEHRGQKSEALVGGEMLMTAAPRLAEWR